MGVSKSDRAFSAPTIIAASGCEASVGASTLERVKGLSAHLGGIDLLGIMMGSHGLTCSMRHEQRAELDFSHQKIGCQDWTEEGHRPHTRTCSHLVLEIRTCMQPCSPAVHPGPRAGPTREVLGPAIFNASCSSHELY